MTPSVIDNYVHYCGVVDAYTGYARAFACHGQTAEVAISSLYPTRTIRRQSTCPEATEATVATVISVMPLHTCVPTTTWPPS